ncbi:MAG TPA: indole-3-glycerol phosphate synthase TrpC [Polyangia bacterium]|jgi:indole-3-glycerol phosphate synthase
MILDDILARTRAELPERKQQRSSAELERLAGDRAPVRSLRAALRRPGQVTAIAEFKRRSPSLGWIREGADAGEIVRAYASAGAAALSVLTDEPFFGGTLADLGRAREAAIATPILRKDFIVDEYQIVEARAAGADAVLLIVAALDDATLRALFAACSRWGVEALVETHDAGEVERAVALGAGIIGINHRDLHTFTLDRELAARLRPGIPRDTVVVAESGIRDAADVARMGQAGLDAVLVGEALMRADDPGAKLAELLA